MRRHEQDEAAVPGLLGGPFEALFDVALPVAAGPRALGVESRRKAGGLEVGLQPLGERRVLIVAVAEDDATHTRPPRTVSQPRDEGKVSRRAASGRGRR
jgi:hypothetical protein